MSKSDESSGEELPLETSPSLKSHPTKEELYAFGKSLRDKCPRQSHAAWQPLANRPDPLALLEESNKGRMPQLIPVRHGRMLQSPFTFYRSSKRMRARADTATTASASCTAVG